MLTELPASLVEELIGDPPDSVALVHCDEEQPEHPCGVLEDRCGLRVGLARPPDRSVALFH
jgi:hypothetical protein